jgi:hypothetical protein
LTLQDHGALLLSHARLLKQVGRPDDALLELEQARGLFKGERDQAITQGDIARLLAAKGEVDQELKLHQESLFIYEALWCWVAAGGQSFPVAQTKPCLGSVASGRQTQCGARNLPSGG